MKLFKKKKKSNSLLPLWGGGKWESSQWWKKLCAKFKKDTGGPIDKNDPEYDAQKIYMHWIKSFR